MIKIVKILLLQSTILTLMMGCTTISCEEFDVNRQIMDWHFFPKLLDQYSFRNLNSDSIIFTQTSFEKSEFEEKKCHLCACGQVLRVSYENQTEELVLSNVTNYDTHLFPEGIGGINYLINDVESFLTIEHDILVEIISEPAGETKSFSISNVENETLNNINYDRLTKIEIINTQNSPINTFWIQESVGLVAFEITNTIWTKE